MKDQADNLRRLLERTTPRPPHKARRMAFLSGKGGVGKTSLAVNMALALSRMGHRTILVDCDIGLANADFLLGVQAKSTLDSVFMSGQDVRKAVVIMSSGLWLVPGAGAIIPRQAVASGRLEHILERLDPEAEFIVLDGGAGIDEGVQYLARISDEVVIIAMPESAAAINAYRLIKVIHENRPAPAIRLVINRADSHSAAYRTAAGIIKASSDFLDMQIEYVGWIPNDPTMEQAARDRRPLVEKFPASNSARSIVALATRLIQPPPAAPEAA
jgi:flagellar biosynthesis protein FlhG